MVNWEADSHRLAYAMEEMKLELAARIMRSDLVHSNTGAAQDCSAAMELCLWCLQPNADCRPQSIDDVLKSRLFTESAGVPVRLSFKKSAQLIVARGAVRATAG